MKRFQLWAILVLVLALAGAGGFAWWNYDLRWRPHTITKHQDEIARILETSGWVSPGKTGPKLYMVSFRACPDCVRYKAEEFPLLQAAGVDTRVIEIARRDVNGVAKSTAAERATVAELWLNRSWPLMEQWKTPRRRPGPRRASPRPTATWRARRWWRQAARWSPTCSRCSRPTASTSPTRP